MQVSVGFATEYARFRHSVTVEETDLERLLAEEGIEASLTSAEVFLVMDAMAQRLCIQAQKEAATLSDEAARKRMGEWTAVLDQRVQAVRERQGG